MFSVVISGSGWLVAWLIVFKNLLLFSLLLFFTFAYLTVMVEKVS